MGPRKRSNIVVLTLLGVSFGAVELASAFPGQQMRRNLYPNQTACERDYSPTQCQSGTGGTTSSTGGWHGPFYYANRGAPAAQSDPGMGRTGQVTATETSVRGGFGHFGHAMHAGG
jgi:hypothetical protein